MKWKGRKTPVIGQRRSKRRFAWLPVKTDSDMVIWLDFYYVRQMYIYTHITGYHWHTTNVLTKDGFDLFG
jgi:hypothetical protein